MRRVVVQRARSGLGSYGENPSVTPRSGAYNENTVFNASGAAGGELTINGPTRRTTQFGFEAGPVPLKILSANDRRFYLIIQNKSVADVLYFGFAASVNAVNGIGLAPGAVAGTGGNFFGDYMVPPDDIWVFSPTAAVLGVCAEGVLIS